MQRLFTIGYPEISPRSAAFIDAFRQQYDVRHRDVVEAHFTMVFGCAEIDLKNYTNHVASIATSSKSINFSCEYAMLGAEDEDDTAYVFLVPDQGYAAVSLPHDRLYTGLLRPYLRLDLPDIPYITIGTLASRVEAKALCDDLNGKARKVSGSLKALTVGAIENGKFKNYSVHALSEA